jgi:hypothetical protein
VGENATTHAKQIILSTCVSILVLVDLPLGQFVFAEDLTSALEFQFLNFEA